MLKMTMNVLILITLVAVLPLCLAMEFKGKKFSLMITIKVIDIYNETIKLNLHLFTAVFEKGESIKNYKERMEKNSKS